ncbi:MAG: hypothetical protein AAFW00_13435 [Bacteroidota bacterium]
MKPIAFLLLSILGMGWTLHAQEYKFQWGLPQAHVEPLKKKIESYQTTQSKLITAACEPASFTTIVGLAKLHNLERATFRAFKFDQGHYSYWQQQKAPNEFIGLVFSVRAYLLAHFPDAFEDEGELFIATQRAIFKFDSLGKLTDYYPPSEAPCQCPKNTESKGKTVLTQIKGHQMLTVDQGDIDYVIKLIEEKKLKNWGTDNPMQLYALAQSLEMRCITKPNINVTHTLGACQAIIEDPSIPSCKYLAFFAAQKAVLLGAQGSNFKIRDSGDLTFYAEQLLLKSSTLQALTDCHP